MPIVGNLSEFPLPEVLLLIGQRTGRLRLLDVPEFGVLDLDISNGVVQVMRVGTGIITETQRMLDKLGAVVQVQSGMFEFRLVPVTVVAPAPALTIHDLAMQLVCHVDEQAARDQLSPSPEHRYKLVIPEPEIWMEPELDQFFQMARSFLSIGVSLGALARNLQIDTSIVHKNLTNLHQLGLIESGEEEPHAKVEDDSNRRQLAQKTSAFVRVSRVTESIRKLSSKLPMI